jgi:hypothetical protein
MNDLLRKNNDQPTYNINVSCVQTVGLKHAKGRFVLDIRILFSESITTSVLLCRERLYNFFGSLLSVNCFDFIFNQNLTFQKTMISLLITLT